MSSDVIIGHDGKPRCVWAGAGDTAFGRYHDEVWGTRTYVAIAVALPSPGNACNTARSAPRSSPTA
jgi:hypothetical protein